MNTPHLYDFLGIIDRAHGIARIIDSINELLAFNGYYNIDEFKKFLKKKSKKAYLEHIPISLGNVEGFSIYMNYLNDLINPDYSSAEELGIINYCAIFLTVGFYKNSIKS